MFSLTVLRLGFHRYWVTELHGAWHMFRPNPIEPVSFSDLRPLKRGQTGEAEECAGRGVSLSSSPQGVGWDEAKLEVLFGVKEITLR